MIGSIATDASLSGRTPQCCGHLHGKYRAYYASKNRTFRVRDDLDGLLETSARLSGRSVSEEIEYRLDRSFIEGRLIPSRTEDAIRAVHLAMDPIIGSNWAAPPFDDDQRVAAENVRTAVNIIIAAVANLPVMPPPPDKQNLLEGGLENARHLLRQIHVEWPREISSLGKKIDDARKEHYERFLAERAAQDARDAKKTKKAPAKRPEQK